MFSYALNLCQISTIMHEKGIKTSVDHHIGRHLTNQTNKAILAVNLSILRKKEFQLNVSAKKVWLSQVFHLIQNVWENDATDDVFWFYFGKYKTISILHIGKGWPYHHMCNGPRSPRLPPTNTYSLV